MSESFLLDRACSLDKRNKFCSEGISSVLACACKKAEDQIRNLV
jgi:hypothetical protein